MIIHDLKDHLKRKQEAESEEQVNNFRLQCVQATLCTIKSLQDDADVAQAKGMRRRFELDQQALMTVFMLTEQIPWFGTAGVSTDVLARAKDLTATATDALHNEAMIGGDHGDGKV